MRPTCSVHVVWHYFVSDSFTQVPWSMLWPYHQMWLMWLITSNPNPRVQKIEKIKNKSKENKNEKENKKKQSPFSTILTLEGLWEWTQSMDYRNRVVSCKRDNWRLLIKYFKSKPIKKRDKISFQKSKSIAWTLQCLLNSTTTSLHQPLLTYTSPESLTT